MNELIKVRLFRASDTAQVCDLLQEVSSFRVEVENMDRLGNYFLSLNYARAYVVSHEEKIVAFGSIFIFNRIRGGASAVVEDVVVASTMRRRGLGRMILTELIRFARASGCFKITLEASDVAYDFYQSFGFKVGGRSMKLFL